MAGECKKGCRIRFYCAAMSEQLTSCANYRTEQLDFVLVNLQCTERIDGTLSKCSIDFVKSIFHSSSISNEHQRGTHNILLFFYLSYFVFFLATHSKSSPTTFSFYSQVANNNLLISQRIAPLNTAIYFPGVTSSLTHINRKMYIFHLFPV